MGSNHIEHNGSGYADPTLDAVLKRDKANKEKFIEDNNYHVMTKVIKRILENNNYTLEGPISLINNDTGRKRRIY